MIATRLCVLLPRMLVIGRHSEHTTYIHTPSENLILSTVEASAMMFQSCMNLVATACSCSTSAMATDGEGEIIVGTATTGMCTDGCDMYVVFTVIISLAFFMQSIAWVAYTVFITTG